MGLLWTLLPDRYLFLVVIGAAIAMLVGLVRPRAAGGLVGGIILMLLLGPVFSGVMGLLPSWLVVILIVLFLFSFLRTVFGLFLGPHGAQVALGHITAVILIDTMALPFRLVAWVVRVSTGRHRRP